MASIANRAVAHDNPERNPFRVTSWFIMVNHHDSWWLVDMIHHDESSFSLHRLCILKQILDPPPHPHTETQITGMRVYLHVCGCYCMDFVDMTITISNFPNLDLLEYAARIFCEIPNIGVWLPIHHIPIPKVVPYILVSGSWIHWSIPRNCWNGIHWSFDFSLVLVWKDMTVCLGRF